MAPAAPFRVGVMQLTMEPLEEILEHARVMDEAGFDTIWLAEAYPWWRKHSMEARSSTALSALVARETSRLAVGWGIISPYTRHPIQIAMEARVTQEAAGPGRFYLGLGVSKIFMRHAGIGDGAKPVAGMKEAAETGGEGAREIAGMYLANKVQNIQAAADTLLECAGLTQEEIVPVAEAMEHGGRLAAKAAVTDEILDKCKPIAGTPEDCIAAIEEYRDAGCTHVMLELWGDDRAGQLRLFGEQVLPHFR